jgi:hypothetical protein
MYLSFLLLLLSFLLSFDCLSTDRFVHRDQFLEDEQSKKIYSAIHRSNREKSEIIREFKRKNPKHVQNIMFVTLYAFHDNYYEQIDFPRIFESGWISDEDRNKVLKEFQPFNGRTPFHLGDAYKAYNFFDLHSDVLKIKRTSNDDFLSQAIIRYLDKKSRRQPYNYNQSFISKLLDDFRVRSINFDTREDSSDFNHQNHSHTEQAFFSYVEHSLEKTFEGEALPKSILVNKVSYLPICDSGFCLKAIKTLLSDEDESNFKSSFVKKLFPKAYSKIGDSLWKSSMSNLKINLLFTSSDIASASDFDLINNDKMLFRAFN